MSESMHEELVTIGRSPLQVLPLGLGAWSWGDRLLWAYGSGYDEPDVRAAYRTSIEAGPLIIDTAESYGRGRSEALVGRFLAEEGGREQATIATKFMPFPWRLTRQSLLRALRASLERMRLSGVDLYQIHIPLPPRRVETWAEALAEAVELGLVRAVGVSNYSARQMVRTHAVLARHGVPLASNQVEYSLLHRAPERSGVLEACKELGVTLIAYSPLAKGILTGKYSPERRPPGVRRILYASGRLERAGRLVDRLRRIGERHGGRSPAQVALNWLICRGALPIPGAKNAAQARENLGALGWRLSPEEVDELAAAASAPPA